MPKNQKQKTSIRKRTTTKKKKRTYGIDIVNNASEERVSIISTVKGLEGQVETVFKLNEILEAQLDEAQKKLSEELGARVQSEVQVARRLEASEASKVALEKELAGTTQALRAEVGELQAKAEKLRDELTVAEGRTADLRIQLEDQQATNRKLIETTTHLENEIKMVNINYDANKDELDAFKNAVRDIRSEATRTSGRVQQKFLQSKKRANSSRGRPQPPSTKT